MLAWWEIVIRMLLATFVGGLLGWERAARGKPAGLRTLALVSLASAVFILAGVQGALLLGEPVQAMRGMAGIAGGIGFLGAGVILQARREVRWLTTAAALWAAAGLGVAAGLGLYVICIAGGALTYAVLCWFLVVEQRWVRKQKGNGDKQASDR